MTTTKAAPALETETSATRTPLDLAAPRGGKLWSTLRLMRAPREVYGKWLGELGDPVRLHAINGDFVLTGSPDGARDVFSANPEIYEPFGVEAAAPLVGRRSVFLLDGQEHHRERKLLRPPFYGKRMQRQGELMVQSARRHFAALPEGAEFKAHDVMLDISLEIIARTIFGTRSAEETAGLVGSISDVLDSVHPLMMFSPSLQVAPFGLGPWAKFLRKREALYDRVRELIVKRRAQMSAGEEPGDDILTMLLESRYEDGESMSDEALRDELLTLLVAGHETTSVSLAWAMYWLHRNPDALAKLRAELTAKDAPQDLVARARLPYLTAVCQETLRLRPILSDVLRKLKEPLTVLGVEVPAGWCVAVSIMTVHEDPELYPEPSEFRPERFIERRFSAVEYMPFGGGHRRCIGAPFAMYEMALVLDEVIRSYECELNEPREVRDVRRNITMGPATGVRMRFLGRRPESD